jgi:hypothetical protein
MPMAERMPREHAAKHRIWAGHMRPAASVESDASYFARNPHATSRIRLAFPGEFAGAPLGPAPPGHAVVVIVAVCRDPRTGALYRARGVSFLPAGSA